MERYNGTYERECLQVRHPTDLAQAQAVTEWFVQHYNGERPNQAWSCANRPPQVAFRSCLRCVHSPTSSTRCLVAAGGGVPMYGVSTNNGTIKVDTHVYYIKRARRCQQVKVKWSPTATWSSSSTRPRSNACPYGGLTAASDALEEFVTFMLAQAQRMAALPCPSLHLDPFRVNQWYRQPILVLDECSSPPIPLVVR
ncbi:MAG: integrase core domain-containing protein [Anaerolineae bacterium]|nr:integrase core domain-containing protein [Anaerolineae bacterium]